MGKIRMGVVGYGGIARIVHIPQIIKSSEAKLTAICDIDIKKLENAKATYGIDEKYCFEDYKELIKCKEVDAISICTPNDVHYEVALECIKEKKPFAIEKPITLNKDNAKTLMYETNKNNLDNMVCFSYRFKSAARMAKKIIEDGQLGKIIHVYVKYFQAWAINEDLPLIWRLQRKHAGSGALGDLGSHMIDLVRFITNSDYDRVCSHMGNFIKQRKRQGSEDFGVVDVDDFCHVFAEMTDEISAVFEITRCASGRGNYQRIEIYGTNGGLVYNLDDSEWLEICIGKHEMEARDYHNIKIPQKYNSNQMSSFFNILNNKSDNLHATIEDGYKTQVVIDEIINSSKNNKWIDINY